MVQDTVSHLGFLVKKVLTLLMPSSSTELCILELQDLSSPRTTGILITSHVKFEYYSIIVAEVHEEMGWMDDTMRFWEKW